MKKIRVKFKRSKKQSLVSYLVHKVTGKRHWFAVSSTFYALKGDHTPHSVSVDSMTTVGLIDRSQAVTDWRSIRKLIGPGLTKELVDRRLVKDGQIMLTSISYLGWF